MSILSQINGQFDHEDFTATYSAEDNKLRLYFNEWLGDGLFAELKKMGFVYAPKLAKNAGFESMIQAAWTPSRLDICLAFAGELMPEETTIVERAELKAARLDGYRNNQLVKSNSFSQAANKLSERFYMGQPILVGHHSERKARKDQERMHSAMDKSIKALDTANYWGYRAEGVERHANMKSNPRTRLNRIKTLLKDLRDFQRTINHAQICLKLWSDIQAIECEENRNKMVERHAGTLIETGYASHGETYNKLNSGEWTHDKAIEVNIESNTSVINSDDRARWIAHTLNRLGYERNELGEVTRFDGELTAVILQAFTRTHGAHKPKATQDGDNWTVSSFVDLPLHLGEGHVLTLSSEQWRDLMLTSGYEVPEQKKRATSKKAATVSLINPTLEDAEKLQALWNTRHAEKSKANSQKAKSSEVKKITQKVYSNNSRGYYTPCRAVELDKFGNIISTQWRGGERIKTGEPVCKVRIFEGGFDFCKPVSVIHLTDKKAKGLPFVFEETAEV